MKQRGLDRPHGITVAIVHRAELGGRLETVYEIVDLQALLRLLWEDQHACLARFLKKLHALRPALAQPGKWLSV